MLNVQRYLETHSFEDLHKELAIELVYHPTLPLVILNYDQIDSPKSDPVVRECRALTLRTDNKALVSKSFNRFYNWGEMADEMPLFDWNSCTTQTKEDGSLVKIYNFEGEWHANTRGSFGGGPILNEYQAAYFNLPKDFIWREAFCKALGINSLSDLKLDPALTYVCEFCSLWNKVVREYKTPRMYLLTRFAGEEEIGADDNPLFSHLESYPLHSVEDISKFLLEHPEATYEGVVTKDKDFRRWKFKNLRYVSLHHLRGNGDQLWNPKYLVPFILKGETDELKTYFPENSTFIDTTAAKVDEAFLQMKEVWEKNWEIENQKDFALSIVGKTPFTGILFNVRKKLGKAQTLKDLKLAWQLAGDGIVKTLF